MADTQKNILINIDLETGQVNSQLDEIDSKIGNLGNNVNLNSFKSVRSEILAAREEAVRLAIAIEEAEAAGQNVDNLSQRYTEVTSKAAQLNDAVEDVNNSIANANPDNRLQGLVSIAQGAIVAIQGVASAFTLIGVDAETAQVAVAKLQAIIGLTSALSSIDQITKGFRDLTNIINLTAVAQRANNVATAAAVVIQRTFTSTVVATGTAFRALRLAIAATGIGLLVVAIAGAVVAIKSFIDATNDAKQVSEDFNRTLDSTIEKYDDLAAANQRAGQLILAELKAQGKSETEQRAAQLRNTENQLRIASQKVLDLQRQFNEALAKRRTGILGFFLGPGVTQEDLQKASDAIKTALDEQTTAQNNVRIQEANNRAADLADLKRKNEQKIQNEKEAVERRKRLINELNDFIQQERIAERARFESDLQNQIDEIDRRYEKEIEKAKKVNGDIVELRRLRASAIASVTRQEEIRAEQFGIEATLELVNKQVEILSKKLVDTSNKLAGNISGATGDFEGNATIWRTQLEGIATATSQELSKILTLGTQLRTAQLELERDARIESLQRLSFSPERREELERVIREDFQIQINAIEKEFRNQEDTLNRSLQLTGFKINLDAALREIERIQAAINELSFRQSFPDTELIERLRNQEEEITSIRLEYGSKSVFNEQDFSEQRKDLIKSFNDNIAFFEQQRNLVGKDEQETYNNIIIELEKQKNQELVRLQTERNQKQADLDNQFNQRLLIERRKLIDIDLSRDPLSSGVPGEESLARNLFASRRQKQVFDQSLKLSQEFFQAQTNIENSQFNIELERLRAANQETEQLERDHKQRLLDIEQNYRNNVQIINDAVLQNKLSIVSSIGDAIGNLGRFYDQSTKEAKVLAVAEIAINTATGFIQGLDLAQKTAKAAPPPAIPFVFAAFYASQVAAVLGAAARAKQILSRVEGPQPAADSAGTQTPQAINASLFNLPQQVQNVRVTGAPDQVVRAFITTGDLRTAQERADFLNKLSRF